METRRAGMLLACAIAISYAASAENKRYLHDDRTVREFDVVPPRRSSSWTSNLPEADLRKLRTQDHSLDDTHTLEEIIRELVSGESVKVWGNKALNKDLRDLFDSYVNTYKKSKSENYTPKGVWGKDDSSTDEREKRQDNIPAGVWGREDTRNSIHQAGWEGHEGQSKFEGGLGDAETERPVGVWGDSESTRPVGVWGDSESIRPVGVWGDAETKRPVGVWGDSESNRPVGVWGREDGEESTAWEQDLNSHKNLARTWGRETEYKATKKVNAEADVPQLGIDNLAETGIGRPAGARGGRYGEGNNIRPAGMWGRDSNFEGAFRAWKRSAESRLGRPAGLWGREQPQRPPGLWGRESGNIVESAKPEGSEAGEKLKLPPGISPGKREE